MSALIFDMDGTLADTIPFILAASHGALIEVGKDVSDATILSYIGLPLIATGEDFLGTGRGEEYLDLYQKHFLSAPYSPQPFPGIIEMMRDLHSAGKKLAIATSKRQAAAEETVAHIGVGEFFDVLVTYESNCGHKPGPGPALKAMELLAAKPEESIFIGDSMFDINCAKNAGIASCGVTWGAADEQELREGGATFIAHTVDQLRQILLDF